MAASTILTYKLREKNVIEKGTNAKNKLFLQKSTESISMTN
jgi:hypothetical protein